MKYKSEDGMRHSKKEEKKSDAKKKNGFKNISQAFDAWIHTQFAFGFSTIKLYKVCISFFFFVICTP